MSENQRLHTKALYGFDHVVRLAEPGAWDRPSPCEGWTARHVVGHVVAIQRYLEATAAGRTPTMNPMEDPDRHAGDDPALTWRLTLDDVLALLDEPGVLDRRVDSSWGKLSVDEMIGFNVGDTTVHGWDLARALGVDDRLDPMLVVRSLELLEPVVDGLRDVGVIGPPVDVEPHASMQARLLGLVGRQS